MPTLTVANLLADLTHLKTLDATQALLLLRGPPPHTPSLPRTSEESDDAALVRAHEFIRLRAEEVGRGGLEAKRRAVERALRREPAAAEEMRREESAGWEGRMAGGWGRWE